MSKRFFTTFLLLIIFFIVACSEKKIVQSPQDTPSPIEEKLPKTLQFDAFLEVKDEIKNPNLKKGTVKLLHTLPGFPSEMQRSRNDILIMAETNFENNDIMEVKIYRWNLLSKSIQTESKVIRNPRTLMYITKNDMFLKASKFSTGLYKIDNLTKPLAVISGWAPYYVMGESDDLLYLLDKGISTDYVYCLDLKQGKVLWKYPEESKENKKYRFQEYAYEKGGKVLLFTEYADTEGFNTLLLSTSTGKEESIQPVKEITKVDEIISINSDSHLLLSYPKLDGKSLDTIEISRIVQLFDIPKIQWKQTIAYSELPSNLSGDDNRTKSLSDIFVKDNKLWILKNLFSYNRYYSWLFSINLEDGSKNYPIYLGERNPFFENSNKNGILFIPLYRDGNQIIAAYEPTNDIVLWYKKYPGSTSLALQVYGEEIWVTNASTNQISCLDVTTGKELFVYDIPENLIKEVNIPAGGKATVISDVLRRADIAPTGSGNAQLITFDGNIWELKTPSPNSP